MQHFSDEFQPTSMSLNSENTSTNDAKHDPVREAFRNAEWVHLGDYQNRNLVECEQEEPASGKADTEQRCSSDLVVERCPIVPLGQMLGNYYFISASGEFRSMRAEALEAGRGVRALLSGFSRDIDAWCEKHFPAKDGGWSHREAGQWIIEKCNAKGVFDPNSADIRSVGVWRDENGKAIAHCGSQLAQADGCFQAPTKYEGKCIMIAAARITPPDFSPISTESVENLLSQLRALWGWKRSLDADIFFGWVAAASLGGFPAWRSHLYVCGTRGSGKSKLMEIAAALLGEFAGSVLNDSTEAGLRQSRNNQARPILIDEFEQDESARNGSKQDNMLALFRRMSGGDGGRVSRGGADHSSVSFRSLGAAYVTSINHIHLEP